MIAIILENQQKKIKIYSIQKQWKKIMKEVKLIWNQMEVLCKKDHLANMETYLTMEHLATVVIW